MRKSFIITVTFLCSSAFVLAAGPARAAEQPLNLLFFGNSFTIGNGSWTLPTIVTNIAVAPGHVAPNTYQQMNGGWKLSDHVIKVSSDGSANVIDNSLPVGQTWDAVVLQGYSTEATTVSSVGGNRTSFTTNATTLADHVQINSPNMTPVLFETWARQPGHSYYPGTFADAAAMQSEVRDGYNMARDAVDQALGDNITRVAPAGDAFEQYGWNNLYNSDLYHANNRGELLVGLTIFSTIYQEKVGDIDLSGLMTSMGLPLADAVGLKMAADAVTVVPEPGVATILVGGLALLSLRRRRMNVGTSGASPSVAY